MSSKPTRVVYLSHAFMIGGAEEMVLNLVRRLPARFEPAVCAIHQPGPMGEEIRRTGVAFSAPGLNPGVRRPVDIVRLANHLRRLKPTIVHAFLLTASLYGRLAAILARVPVIVGTEVNIYADKRAAHARAERLLMRQTDAVIASAESVRDFYIRQVGADPAKVEVIYNAVDWDQLTALQPRAVTRLALGIPKDAPTAGVIARLTRQKGHRYLLEAMATHGSLERLHLIVVGDGDLRDELERMVVERGLSSRVHFTGARRDLGSLLAAIDVFVMPSLWEGLPLSLVLAMGAGLPVIATRVAGMPEVVKDNESGLLVPAGDAGALGVALARLLADGELARRLGTAARDLVQPRFGVEQYVAAVTGLYDRLLAAKGLK